MNKKLIVLAASALLSVAAWAQDATGEVTKIDKAAARITLKHGGVQSLQMPAMTMAFHARDPKLLESVAVGDKVRFAVEKLDGNYTVTALAKAP